SVATLTPSSSAARRIGSHVSVGRGLAPEPPVRDARGASALLTVFYRSGRARAKPTKICSQFAAQGYHPLREVSSTLARQRAARGGSASAADALHWRGGRASGEGARRVRVLLAGGGSGGSATPVLAVAEAWRAREPAVEFVYVGTAEGPERALAEAAGCRF